MATDPTWDVVVTAETDTTQLVLDDNGWAPVILTASITDQGEGAVYTYQWSTVRGGVSTRLEGQTEAKLVTAVASDSAGAAFAVTVTDNASPPASKTSALQTIGFAPEKAADAPEVWTPAFAWVVGLALLVIAVVASAPLYVGAWHSRHSIGADLAAIVALELLVAGIVIALAAVFLMLLEYRGHAVVAKRLANPPKGSILAKAQQLLISALSTATGRSGLKAMADTNAAGDAGGGAAAGDVPTTIPGIFGTLAANFAPDVTAFGKLKASAALLITAILLFLGGAAIAWHSLPSPNAGTGSGSTPSTSTPSTSTPAPTPPTTT